MTRLTYILLGSLVVLVTAAACSKTGPASSPANTAAASPATQRITSEGVVHVLAQGVDIPAGGSADAIVRLTIQNGYHINANPPTYPYLKATVLEITPADGVSDGQIFYPKPVERKFAFADKPLAVYEGETELKVSLKADQTAKKGERSIPARLRIQACDSQVCYPPGAIQIQIAVNVK
ncbi:MAG TPA: protein-disulfide reductase DsbD domain-containing protein [Pyrinomonadaceae bacterium]|jgi:DsbC/DsbD-like thiol-disulfide interchange protein